MIPQVPPRLWRLAHYWVNFCSFLRSSAAWSEVGSRSLRVSANYFSESSSKEVAKGLLSPQQVGLGPCHPTACYMWVASRCQDGGAREGRVSFL